LHSRAKALPYTKNPPLSPFNKGGNKGGFSSFRVYSELKKFRIFFIFFVKIIISDWEIPLGPPFSKGENIGGF
jgi:hypothetical protein